MTNPTEVEKLAKHCEEKAYAAGAYDMGREDALLNEAARKLRVQAAEIARKDAALEGAIVALDECANIMRPKLPSLADNVIALVATKARAALAAPE